MSGAVARAEGGLLSVFVTLTNQSYEGGPLQVWPGSQKNAFNNVEPEGATGAGERLPCHRHPEAMGIKLPMPAGSILMYSSRLVHRGSAYSGAATNAAGGAVASQPIPRHTLMFSVALDTEEVPADALIATRP